MTWQEEVRAAETEEDFERVKKYINFEDEKEFFTNITSPIILRASLRYYCTTEGKGMLVLFYYVGRSCRVDLMDVFFSGFLTLPNLTSTPLRKKQYYNYIEKVVSGGYVDVFAFFLRKGMNPNLCSPYSTEPILSTVCFRGKIDIIDLLLAYDVDVNAKDRYGDTPVFYGIWAKDVRVLDRLIMHGADVYHRNNEGKNIWSFPWHSYRPEMEPNFQRLADMRVPLDKKDYNFVVGGVKITAGMEGILRIMRELLKEQGEDVAEEVEEVVEE